jgi:radical SAM protein with 4Fe4S-binding SPASM domain
MVAPVQAQNELRLLFWETTAGCNLECIHCRRLDVSKQLMKNDLTTEEAFRFVRDLASFAKPILVLSGGEPLFRPDIFQIATCARDCGLPVALATNGTLVDERMAHAIVNAGIRRVAISIDGADEVTHDKFRRQPGSLAAALRGFGHLRRLGMSMQINCTITKHNIHQIDLLYAKALELGADALHLFMLVPVGCGVQIAETNVLPAEEYERVLQWIYEKSLERKIHMKATCAPHYFRVMKQRDTEIRHRMRETTTATATAEVNASRGGGNGDVGGLPAKPSSPSALGHGTQGHPHGAGKPGHPGRHNMFSLTKGCLAGSEICFVSHTGEAFPCGYLPVSAGNIKKQPMRDIWENSPLFGRLRDDGQLEGKCGLCEFKRICMGCRARAYYDSGGNYMAEEPYCVYQPKRLTRIQQEPVCAA